MLSLCGSRQNSKVGLWNCLRCSRILIAHLGRCTAQLFAYFAIQVYTSELRCLKCFLNVCRTVTKPVQELRWAPLKAMISQRKCQKGDSNWKSKGLEYFRRAFSKWQGHKWRLQRKWPAHVFDKMWKQTYSWDQHAERLDSSLNCTVVCHLKYWLFNNEV